MRVYSIFTVSTCICISDGLRCTSLKIRMTNLTSLTLSVEVEIGITDCIVQHYAAHEQHLFPFQRKGVHPLAKFGSNTQYGIAENSFVLRSTPCFVQRYTYWKRKKVTT